MQEPRVTVNQVSKLAYPSILSMVSITIQGFIDTVFISRVGIPQIAAIGLTTWYLLTLLSFLRGFATVINTFTARYLGSRRYKAIGVIVWHVMFVSFVFGILYFCIGLFSREIIRLINPPVEVYGYAVDYLKVRFYEGFFIVGLFTLEEFFRGLKKPYISLEIIALISFINIILDYILIFGRFGIEPMGVQGAAFATVIAELIGFIIFLLVFFNKKNRHSHLTGKIPHLSISLMRRIFRVGIPIGIHGFLDVASFLAFGIIIAKMGTHALAINQIVIQILSLSFMPGFGFGKAATTMVSAYMGAGDIKNARRSVHISIMMALCIMMIISVSFILIPHLYIRIFSKDITLLNLGKQILLIAAITEAFDALGLVFSGALFGAGDSQFVMWLILVGGWCMFIPSTYFLGIILNMGIAGAWISMAFYTLVWGILCLVRFMGKKWEKIKI